MLSMFNLSVCAQNNDSQNKPQGWNMRLKITINNREATATMMDNAAARDFVSLLPLTLTMEDYNQTEKVSNLPKKLSTAGMPSGYAPAIGDISFYAPWGNLCIFYKSFSYSNGLVLLGKIDNDGIEAFKVSDTFTAKFEVIP
jgi:hypothetical protein